MAPYLAFLTSDPTSSVISPDPELLARLQAKNVEQLAKLDATLVDAEKNLGETEISDALKAKALYLAKIGEKVSAAGGAGRYTADRGMHGQELAVEAHEAALAKTAGLGSRIDIRLALIRIGFFHGLHEVISSNIDKAQL
jgi:26S proteasome regulatory subunit N7